MHQLAMLERVDYLVIGHLTCDQTPQGLRIGGTAAYSSLTAHALGLRVGVITSRGNEIPHGLPADIQIINYPVETSTTFENIYTPNGRVQFVRAVASPLEYHLIPEAWRQTPIIHLGPVAQEVEQSMVRYFPDSLIGLTPQGWMREWDAQGRVHRSEWPEASFTLEHAGATVLSLEDVNFEEERIEEMAAHCRILVITEGAQGSRVYWHGDVRRFRAPVVEEVEATGAGDIYAAAFFSRLYTTRDPWESARFATLLASRSVTRSGLDSIPTSAEIQGSTVEVLQ